MERSEKRLTLSSQAFWDFDTTKLDFEKFAEYTVSKVLERGNDSDYDQIIDFYGIKRLKTIISKTHLSPRARNVAQRIVQVRAGEAKNRQQPEVSY